MRILSFVVLVPFLACASTPEADPAPAPEAASAPETAPAAASEAPSFALADPKAVAEKITSGAILVDVRPAKWFEESHIAGSVNLPWKEFDARKAEIEELTGDKSKPIVLFCGNGSMAAKKRDLLKAEGYTDVVAQSIKGVRSAIPAE